MKILGDTMTKSGENKITPRHRNGAFFFQGISKTNIGWMAAETLRCPLIVLSRQWRGIVALRKGTETTKESGLPSFIYSFIIQQSDCFIMSPFGIHSGS